MRKTSPIIAAPPCTKSAPARGGLTREILRAEPDKLTVVEMDERCIAIMEEIKTKVGERLQIVNGDALKQNFAELNQTPCHIVSNLPYNISVPLLVGWLKEIENFASLTLMFQKEVADRILAPVGSKDYGRISILSQLLCKIEKLFDLNPEWFRACTENLVLGSPLYAAPQRTFRQRHRRHRKAERFGIRTAPQNDSSKP